MSNDIVITLRGILIAIGFQSDVASDYYLFIKSVRLATKMGSLILDGLILIWILVYIMMMPRGTVRYPFNWLMNSDTSSVATPGHDDFGRSPGDHQRSWAHGIDASQVCSFFPLSNQINQVHLTFVSHVTLPLSEST